MLKLKIVTHYMEAIHTPVINGIVLSGHAKVVDMDMYNQKGKSRLMPLFIYSYSTVIFYYISLILTL